ncbi:protein IQ-DOMAIN 2 isoform X2 [Manihot esculenta]|uniref:protein IQ-DOMAIN 2 isoform X2 n=1 Tax=Manihot esculenta TaxID=3983 RepID=UPI001CC443AB|nr:protein IQ-DOMAIN 2 isoform X2 [Manihot esculenta]
MSNCRFFCQSLSVCKYHGYIEAAMSIIILCSLRSHLYTRSIGSFYSGFQARRALRALKGLMRLKMLIQGQSVKRQATNTLQAMQTLARVQSQIHARRIRMSEENQALQRQLQQRREKELQKLKDAIGEQWDDSMQSKEQIEASLLQKQEAAMRRERALAYAFSRQQTWKTSSKSANPTFIDQNNPQWGWSWLERWMAARPWESRSTVDTNDHASVKSTASRAMSIDEISRSYSLRDLNRDNKLSPSPLTSNRPLLLRSPSTHPSKAPSISLLTRNTKPSSPKGSVRGGDDDSRSLFRVQSERYSNDHTSVKSTTSLAISIGEISRAYSLRDFNRDNKLSPSVSRPSIRRSPSTSSFKVHSISLLTRNTKPSSPKESVWGEDDDSRSLLSVQSEHYWRHSIAGSSVRDDESLASLPSVPSYMSSTKSAKAKSRLPSPLGLYKKGTQEKASVGSAKKRLSFSASLAGSRRHHGPPRMDPIVNNNYDLHTEEKTVNGKSNI